VALLIPLVIIGIFIALMGLLIAGLVVGASRGASGSSGFQNMLSLVPSGLAVWRGL